MGYETHNSILNLGTLSILLLVYIIGLIFLASLKICLVITGKGHYFYKALIKKLIFGFIISIFIEGYMEFLIAAYLNLIAPLDEEIGDIMALI